jgi:hypothetical protein
MGVRLSDLVPALREKVETLLSDCVNHDVRMVPTFTLRSPAEQAIFWRQSRSIVEINKAIDMLKSEGAPYLASVLNGVGPHSGQHVTNALPGNSWHQWGEAVDCMWEVGGKFIDSDLRKINGVNGYQVYAQTARAMGLESGYFWRSFKDSGHVQLRHNANPKTSGISWKNIDREMQARFGRPAVVQSQSFSAEVAMGATDPIRLSNAAPEGWRVYETTDKTAAVVRSSLSVDADGAPKAYHQDSSKALDFLATTPRTYSLLVISDGPPNGAPARYEVRRQP